MACGQIYWPECEAAACASAAFALVRIHPVGHTWIMPVSIEQIVGRDPRNAGGSRGGVD